MITQFLNASFRKQQGSGPTPSYNRVPKGAGFTTNGSSVTVSGVPVAVGELLVVSVSLAHRSASAANVSISDTASLTWTKVQQPTNVATVDALAAFFYAAVPVGVTSTSITVTNTSPGTNPIMHAAVWGYAAHNGIGATGTAAGPNEVVTFGATTAVDSEVLALNVSSRQAALTLTPVAPAAVAAAVTLSHTAGDGLGGAAGASFESSLISAQGLVASGGGGTITPTLTLLAQATAASFTATTGSVGTTAGRLLIAVVVGATTAAAHPHITSVSGGSLTWTQRIEDTGFDTLGVGIGVYTAIATGAAVAVTGAFSDPGGSNRTKVYLYSAADATGVGLTASADSDLSVGSPVTMSLALGGTTAASSLVLGVAAMVEFSAMTVAPGSGWTEILDEDLTVGAKNLQVEIMTKAGATSTATWDTTGDEYREVLAAIEILGTTGAAASSLSWTMAPDNSEYAEAMVAIEVKRPVAAPTTGSVKINLTGSAGSVNGASFALGAPGTNVTFEAESTTLVGTTPPTSQGSYINTWFPQAAGCGVQFAITAPVTGTYTLRLFYSAQLAAGKKTVKVGGVTKATVDLPLAGTSWTDFSSFVDVQIPLVAGANTISITSDVTAASNAWINLDKIQVNQPGSSIASGTIAAGTVTLSNITPGNYTLTQVNTPSGYVPLAPQPVTVTAGAQTVVNLTQPTGSTPPPVTTGSIRVNAMATNGTNIDGAVFTVSQGATTVGTLVLIAGTSLLGSVPAGTYTVAMTTTPSGYTTPSSQSVVVTAGSTTVANFSVAPSGVITPPTGEVVVGHTNVDQRRADPPNGPTGSGITRSPAASVSAIQAAINAAQPGDCIEVPGGTYNGNLSFGVNGTLANWIVIKPVTGQTVTWSGGQWNWTGNYHVARGFTFAQQDGADRFYVDGTAHHIRVFGNTFNAVGNNSDATINGIFKVMSGPGSSYNNSYVTVTRDLIIDRNTFINSRCCVLWTWPAVKRIFFEHNRITGRGLNLYNECEAIKFGPHGSPGENAESRVAYNTIEDWFSNPYVVGCKMAGVAIVGNWITRGRVELRGGGGYVMSGNVILDGDIAAHDTGNRIAANWVRTINDPTPYTGGLGGLLMIADTLFLGIQYFTRAFRNSIVEDNVFWTPAGSTAWMPMWSRAEFERIGIDGGNGRARNNIIRRNIIAKGNNNSLGGADVGGPSWVVADTYGSGIPPNTSEFLNLNTWTDNILYWSGGTATPSLPGSGNTIVTTAPAILATPPTTRPIPVGDR